jgi:hypothetical protein
MSHDLSEQELGFVIDCGSKELRVSGMVFLSNTSIKTLISTQKGWEQQRMTLHGLPGFSLGRETSPKVFIVDKGGQWFLVKKNRKKNAKIPIAPESWKVLSMMMRQFVRLYPSDAPAVPEWFKKFQ